MLLIAKLLRRLIYFLALLTAAASAAGPPRHGAESINAPDEVSREPIEPIPRASALEPGKIALGERLFHDVRLSSDHSRSCATCHPLERGGMDGVPRAVALNGKPLRRNTLTVFNAALSSSLNWDGVADT